MSQIRLHNHKRISIIPNKRTFILVKGLANAKVARLYSVIYITNSNASRLDIIKNKSHTSHGANSNILTKIY